MPWLIIASFLFLSSQLANPSCCACLPKEVQLTDVVSYQLARPDMQRRKQAITVAEELARLKAHCKKGKLVDGSRRQIYFFRLVGCWGNPPENYQEILQQQNRELMKLKKRYTVIEMTCNRSPALISTDNTRNKQLEAYHPIRFR
jgi:hypothetical protein